MLKLSLIAAAMFALPLAAQAPPPAQSPAPRPAPPAARLEPSRIAPYHHAFQMVTPSGDLVGRLDDQVVVNKDAIIRIQSIEGPAGLMIDTAIADAATLTPKHHSSFSEHRQLRLDFAPKRVTGQFSNAGDPPIPVDQAVADSVFDSNMLDVLIGALPLAPGYAGRVMVYIYEAGGAVPMDVSVRGSEMLKGTDTWMTSVTLGRTTVIYSIGKTDHEVKQVLTPGMRLIPAQP